MLSPSKVKMPTRLIKPYVIAIPSYQRPAMLFKKTLTTLDKLYRGVPIYRTVGYKHPNTTTKVSLSYPVGRGLQAIPLYDNLRLDGTPQRHYVSPINTPQRDVRVIGTRRYTGSSGPMPGHWAGNPMPTVYIFLANDTELTNYQQEYKIFIQQHSNIMSSSIKFVIGVPGLVAQRNFIMNWFRPGQYIIGMDDDVEGIYKLNTHGNPSYKARRTWTLDHLAPGELHELILTGFKKLQEHGAHLWGIHPVDNPYFMSSGMSTDLRFIVGPFYGIINRPEQGLTTPAKNNVERTLQNYKADGAVIRFNYITLRTQYYKNKGGLQAVDIGNGRREKARMAMEYLHTKYPEYTVIHITKKNKWPELKLINKTKKSRIKKLVNNKHNA